MTFDNELDILKRLPRCSLEGRKNSNPRAKSQKKKKKETFVSSFQENPLQALGEYKRIIGPLKRLLR